MSADAKITTEIQKMWDAKQPQRDLVVFNVINNNHSSSKFAAIHPTWNNVSDVVLKHQL